MPERRRFRPEPAGGERRPHAAPDQLADPRRRAHDSGAPAGKTVEALEVFRKNAANHPNSANVYDSLAEAYERSGRLKEAAANYEKAYRKAETTGETELARTAKANFERVSAKLK